MKFNPNEVRRALDADMAVREPINLYSPSRLSTISGLSQPTLWRERQRGRLPEPIRIGRRRIAWTEAQVRTWLQLEK